jgi:cobalt-zinc-cadmium efflux system outer membrane protein
VRGRLAESEPVDLSVEVLCGIALESRPDLLARRLGVMRALADSRLALADRFGEAYILYQPYTFQELAANGTKSATSWAFGLTMPIPVYNRNQGGVIRSRITAEQSTAEVEALRRRIMNEVRDAEQYYRQSKLELEKIVSEQLATARQMRDDAERLFVRGALTALEADAIRKDYNQVVRRYRDTLVRHRRSMLSLNTAVGRRCLP